MNDVGKQEHFDLAEKLIAEQNFAAAVIVGAVAMLLAAVTYGITVATWRFSYGFAAAGIGIVVGLSMRYLGRGIATKFAVVAMIYTFIGCALGIYCQVIVEISVAGATSPINVMLSQPLPVLAERAASYFSWVYLVYWFVAVFFAAFLATRSLSRSERLAVGTYELKD